MVKTNVKKTKVKRKRKPKPKPKRKTKKGGALSTIMTISLLAGLMGQSIRSLMGRKKLKNPRTLAREKQERELKK